jgi:hypothetical protein
MSIADIDPARDSALRPQPSGDPAVILHDRLEGSPRAEDLARALRAEVRDAAWMLSCQLRSGEFRGEDAGSPAFASMAMSTTRLRQYRAGNWQATTPLSDDMPLEAIVERRPIPMRHGPVEMSLDLRLLMGRHWLKMAASLGDFTREFVARYPVAMPPATEAGDAPVVAHWEARCLFEAVAGRRMDGMKLYEQLTGNPPRHVDEVIPALASRAVAVRALEQRFVAWFDRVFHQPAAREGQDAWQPSRMEYQFSCTAPWGAGAKVLTSEEYYHGRLDWYNLDVDRSTVGLPGAAPPAPQLQAVLPAPVSFDGMPSQRWWSFEDRRTNFGEVRPNTTDVAKLLLLEFGLQYGNDFSIVPCTLPQGSLASLRGLVVTTVFGERFWIEAAGSRADETWQSWGLFLLDGRPGTNLPAENLILLLPTPTKVQEGRPLEKVLLVRDEVANVAWGIEESIPLPTGAAKPGLEAAREMAAHFRNASPASAASSRVADIRYQVMNGVPENWIPFIPVHVPGGIRNVQLQRAAMPRGSESGRVDPVRPRTTMLRTNLERPPGERAFHVLEEEVPRSGVSVSMSFQRTRWHDGSVWTWLAMRKRNGRDERTSGLAFDQILPVVNPTTTP